MKKPWPKRKPAEEEQPEPTPRELRVHKPNAPIRFDPRWAPCFPCQKAGCTPQAPCLCACHGGWRVAQLVKAGAAFTAPVPICSQCECVAGTTACAPVTCDCHAASNDTKETPDAAVPPPAED